MTSTHTRTGEPATSDLPAAVHRRARGARRPAGTPAADLPCPALRQLSSPQSLALQFAETRQLRAIASGRTVRRRRRQRDPPGRHPGPATAGRVQLLRLSR